MYKYLMICQEIENKIKNNEYRQGERLPSLRQLMVEYNCSQWIAKKCYEELEKRHVVYSKQQSGYYVADSLNPLPVIENEFALHTGNPIVSLTSLSDAKHCLSIAIDHYSHSSLNMTLHGVESLRLLLPEFLSRFGIYTKVNQIYPIQGIMQILSFLTTYSFSDRKEYILIEEPTYSYYIEFLKQIKVPVVSVHRDENGINLDELESIFQNYKIKFFYIVPRNHNPLGTTLNSYTRQSIAKLAQKYNILIVEDDYFMHCSSSPRYLPIYYYMEGKKCLYLTSFSKIIPYIRIGICVVPEMMLDIFEKIIHEAYYYSYQLPSLISQATLESYIRSGLYDKQTQSIIHFLKDNYDIIKKHKEKWDACIAKIISDFSGYYVSVLIHKDIPISKLQEKLKRHRVFVARNERCFYLPDDDNHSIRLSLARILPSDLDKALELIYEVLNQLYIESREASK